LGVEPVQILTVRLHATNEDVMVAASTGVEGHKALLRSQDMHVDCLHLGGPDKETAPAGTDVGGP
jgi:hypothetical protein